MSTGTLAPSDQATKTCSSCGRSLPLTVFRRKSSLRTLRDSRCRECHVEGMREYRKHRRLAKMKRFAGELKRAQSASQVVVLVNAVVRQFGGVDQFTREWKDSVDSARMADPGSRTVLSNMLAVAKLIEISSRYSLAEIDFSSLSDEDLEIEIDRLVTERLYPNSN